MPRSDELLVRLEERLCNRLPGREAVLDRGKTDARALRMLLLKLKVARAALTLNPKPSICPSSR